MSNIFSKFFMRLLYLFIAVAAFSYLRESIFTNDAIGIMFDALIGALPFSEILVGIILNLMGYSYEIPAITFSTVITDLMKLLVMACIHPMIVRALSKMFLRLPSEGSVYEMERRMEGLGYRLKEFVIMVLTAPFIALPVSWLTAVIYEYFGNAFGPVLSWVFKVLSLITVGGLSIIPLVATAGVGMAITWRLLTTIGGRLLSTLVTEALSLWLYLTILTGSGSQTFWAIVSIIVWIIIFELIMNSLRRSIVSVFK